MNQWGEDVTKVMSKRKTGPKAGVLEIVMITAIGFSDPAES